MPPPSEFHPAVARWFVRRFAAPTAAQAAAWPAIRAGRHTLVAAPTGSGKTLTAFLAAIDALVRQGLGEGGLPDATAVVYVSPLKALSNDIQANLEQPLAGIRAELAALGLPDVQIRTAVRTGDTPARERRASLRRPPHILVTTPESLYVLLGSPPGRALLSTVRSVIVDEIHALAPNKRGSHLALSLERLQTLCAAPLTRIGLSATQKPIDAVASFLVGAAAVSGGVADCEVVDIGHGRPRDLALELPPTPLGAVMSNDQWQQVFERLVQLSAQHRTTLVFVNTRRMAERAARHLGELLGPDAVAAHHGSLSRETRLAAEQRLKRGELRLLVATASLELGLDIGEIDLVCQLGSPRSISTFLQRAGRSGHAVGGTPKARLFPQTIDELVECAALLDAVRRGELDALALPAQPLDVLAQQIVAEVACREWQEDNLFALVRQAWPYAALTRADFDAVLRMLVEGHATRQGPRGALIHRDGVGHRLRERRGARMTALTSGGTIPDTGDYAVVLEPQADRIGSVNEDFAVESLAGDVFQLGNTSYRILRIEPGRVRVEDAHGAPPNIPFWLGEAPGRSAELSFAVSRLRAQVEARLASDGADAARRELIAINRIDAASAQQIVEHLAAARAVLGELPTQQVVVIERFFDQSEGMQLVIHAPFGSRINRAWGLALRKRFCRQFDFELQAAATEDAIILSLSTRHSFALDEVARYLHPTSALDVLVQALLDAPLFGVRWRWNATTALALPRFTGGRKVAPQLQRMRSEDLLAAIFPDQLACAENLSGPREIPDHPLVAQTLHDCLHEAMDAGGWLQLLQRIVDGEVRVLARDLPAPSPLAAEALQARPYAYLDDAPIEERRSQAVQARRYGDPGNVDELGQLDADAIAAVRAEAWPVARNADELHEALTMLGLITAQEAAAEPGWPPLLRGLARGGRATRLRRSSAGGELDGWVAAERLASLRLLYPDAVADPPLEPPSGGERIPPSAEQALQELLRARLGGLGPVELHPLARQLDQPPAAIDAALRALQRDGSVFEGRISPGSEQAEWCERHLLARIHRYTLKQLRREIEPVELRDMVRFLFEWQHLAPGSRLRGPDALPGVLALFEGFEAPAPLWESELLPARVDDYSPAWLDDLCTAGRIVWTRLRPVSAAAAAGAGAGSLRTTPIALLPRRSAPQWSALAGSDASDVGLGARSRRVVEHLERSGASFFDEIAQACRLLPAELEDALADGVARGRIHCDSFAGLRALIAPAAKRGSAGGPRTARRRAAWFGIEDAGRWNALRPTQAAAAAASSAASGAEPMSLSVSVSVPASTSESALSGVGPSPGPDAGAGAAAAAANVADAAVEHVARTLLRRYGVICWRLLEREAAWLPPWRELLRVLRRLEARGEVRGGRFIAGVTGEQYALPDAVALLRQVRRQPPDGAFVVLAAADPANLLGSLLPGPKVARIGAARVLYRDGVPLATSSAGKIEWLVDIDPAERQRGSRALLLDPGMRQSMLALPQPVPAER